MGVSMISGRKIYVSKHGGWSGAMRHIVISVVICIYLLTSRSVGAQEISSEIADALCSGDSSYGYPWCLGFVMGSSTQMKFAERIMSGDGSSSYDHSWYFLCAEKYDEPKELVRIFREYLQDHEDQKNTPASIMFARAMSERYPCK